MTVEDYTPFLDELGGVFASDGGLETSAMVCCAIMPKFPIPSASPCAPGKRIKMTR